MKFTTLFAAAAAGLFLCSVSCERHEWSEVKQLHEQHGHGGHAAGGEHATGGEHHEDKGHDAKEHESGAKPHAPEEKGH